MGLRHPVIFHCIPHTDSAQCLSCVVMSRIHINQSCHIYMYMWHDLFISFITHLHVMWHDSTATGPNSSCTCDKTHLINTLFIYISYSATHCNILQHTATHCNTLQHTATYCNTLQHTATHCTLFIYISHDSTGPSDVGTTYRAAQFIMVLSSCLYTHTTLQRTATHCNTLQHTLQHAATPSCLYRHTTLQHTATHQHTL